MNYGVRLYINSGFNSVNIPDNPTLLDGQNNFIDVPALDILQDRNLSVIRVKVLWDNVKDADYLRLTKTGTQESWYYSVDDIIMENTDTASLSVTPDYINSIGGVANIDIIDGVTERVHVSDDTFGLYNEDDELLTPEEPLKMASEWIKFDPGNGSSSGITQDFVCIESTINPECTANIKEAVAYKSIDPLTSEIFRVTVPKPISNTHNTEYGIDDANARSQPERGTCLYRVFGNNFIESLGVLRGLGLEQSILAQVIYPLGYVIPVESSDTMDGVQYHYIASMTGKKVSLTPQDIRFKLELYPSVKNNRINYSKYLNYGLITCNGETLEALPSELALITTQGIAFDTPSVLSISDPSPDGKPYFRFKYMVDGNADVFPEIFWRNCISGLQWKQLPLIFQGASGSILNTRRANANMAIENISYQGQQLLNQDAAIRDISDLMFGIANTAVGAGVAMTTKGFTGAASIVGGYHNAINSIIDLARLEDEHSINRYLMKTKRKSELLDLAINNTIVVPTISFPFNSEVLRDFYGNNVLMYRRYYTGDDVTRIDKLLTMFGYKHVKFLENSDFTNRQYFNFVKCNNVSVTGNARYINEGIAEQLSGGVRIWHVKPNKTYYNNNPIRNNS